jgi:hypothetical protein
LCAALAVCLGVCPRGAAAAQRTATSEDNIKAAFLYNFTKFIQWPPVADTAPFRLCTVAEPAFGTAVDRIIEGESVAGRSIVRTSPATPEAARGCHILFLGRLENDRAERWITTLRGTPVLVVGESRGVWDQGAHINFVLDGNRVKFDVNTDATTEAGLHVSSKLLRVAREVHPRRGPP